MLEEESFFFLDSSNQIWNLGSSCSLLRNFRNPPATIIEGYHTEFPSALEIFSNMIRIVILFLICYLIISHPMNHMTVTWMRSGILNSRQMAMNQQACQVWCQLFFATIRSPSCLPLPLYPLLSVGSSLIAIKSCLREHIYQVTVKQKCPAQAGQRQGEEPQIQQNWQAGKLSLCRHQFWSHRSVSYVFHWF